LSEADALANRLHQLVLEASKKEALKERIDPADARLEQLPQMDRSGEEDVMACLDERLDSLRDKLRDFIDDRFNELLVDHVLREMRWSNLLMKPSLLRRRISAISWMGASRYDFLFSTTFWIACLRTLIASL
jgi:hypothetical protein